MQWPPCFTLDLVAEGLLPADWEQSVEALGAGPKLPIITERDPDWQFSIIEGDGVRAGLGWLFDLYLGAIREFANRSFDRTLFPCRSTKATITLNLLEGAGAHNDWHRDSNPITAVFFARTMAADQGGVLEFRSDDGETFEIVPRAGTLVCMNGRVSHRVTPLAYGSRISFALLYFDDIASQTFPAETPDYIARFL